MPSAIAVFTDIFLDCDISSNLISDALWAQQQVRLHN